MRTYSRRYEIQPENIYLLQFNNSFPSGDLIPGVPWLRRAVQGSLASAR